MPRHLSPRRGFCHGRNSPERRLRNSRAESASLRRRASLEDATHVALLRRVFDVVDQNNTGEVGAHVLLKLGVMQRKLGHKSGEWTEENNNHMLAEMEGPPVGAVAFCKYFSSKLPKDPVGFEHEVKRLMQVAEACRDGCDGTSPQVDIPRARASNRRRYSPRAHPKSSNASLSCPVSMEDSFYPSVIKSPVVNLDYSQTLLTLTPDLSLHSDIASTKTPTLDLGAVGQPTTASGFSVEVKAPNISLPHELQVPLSVPLNFEANGPQTQRLDFELSVELKAPQVSPLDLELKAPRVSHVDFVLKAPSISLVEIAESPSQKGVCKVCKLPVLSTQQRVKGEGVYMHAECFRQSEQFLHNKKADNTEDSWSAQRHRRCIYCRKAITEFDRRVKCKAGYLHAVCAARAQETGLSNNTRDRSETSGSNEVKGMCVVCQLPVLVSQSRAKIQDGNYVHRMCIEALNSGRTNAEGRGSTTAARPAKQSLAAVYKAEGLTAIKCRNEGLPLSECLSAGYSMVECKEAGYTLREFVVNSSTKEECYLAGFSMVELSNFAPVPR